MKALDWLMERLSNLLEEKPIPFKNYDKLDTGVTKEEWLDIQHALNEASKSEEGKRFDEWLFGKTPKESNS
jgi:hypothetical protein